MKSFNEPFYKWLYPDLESVGNLYDHFNDYGRHEGRVSNKKDYFKKIQNNLNFDPSIVNWSIYRDNYEDIKSMHELDLIRHYVNHGINEGRTYKKNTLVISRYNEDVSWVNNICDEKWISEILIFNKGPSQVNTNNYKIKIFNVENVGREGGTYLDYIINNYHNLPDNVWFLQADPFEHSPDFLNFFKQESVNKYISSDYIGFTTIWKESENIPPFKEVCENNRFDLDENLRNINYLVNKYTWQIVGHNNFWDWGIGEMHKFLKEIYGDNYSSEENNIVPSIADVAMKNFNLRLKKILPFTLSATFKTNKKSILRNSLEEYNSLKNFLLVESKNSQGGPNGYVLERLWHYIFTHNSYDSLDEYYRLNISSEMVGSYNKKLNEFKIVNRNKCELKINENQDCIVLFKEDGKIKSFPCIELDNESKKQYVSIEEAKNMLANM